MIMLSPAREVASLTSPWSAHPLVGPSQFPPHTTPLSPLDRQRKYVGTNFRLFSLRKILRILSGNPLYDSSFLFEEKITFFFFI